MSKQAKNDAELYRNRWLVAHNCLHSLAISDNRAFVQKLWQKYLSSLNRELTDAADRAWREDISEGAKVEKS